MRAIVDFFLLMRALAIQISYNGGEMFYSIFRAFECF